MHLALSGVMAPAPLKTGFELGDGLLLFGLFVIGLLIKPLSPRAALGHMGVKGFTVFRDQGGDSQQFVMQSPATLALPAVSVTTSLPFDFPTKGTARIAFPILPPLACACAGHAGQHCRALLAKFLESRGILLAGKC